jgi:hypothetical protein
MAESDAHVDLGLGLGDTERRCHQCGSVEFVFLDVDPFVNEVCPPPPGEAPLTPELWCESCYRERKDQV